MSKRLLLADDSITIQKVIGITFANEDYQLDIVDNGDDALEHALAQKPDIVLADVYMPGRNGYELCAAIKEDPSLSGVQVMLLTGTFEPFDEGKAVQAGADGWISKPFESQALIDRVEELLAKAAEQPAPLAPAPPSAEPDVEEEPAEPVDEPLADGDDDIWGDVSFDEDDLVSEVATEGLADMEEEPAPPSGAGDEVEAAWEEAGDDIFDLADEDIIDEADLLEDFAETEPGSVEPVEEIAAAAGGNEPAAQIAGEAEFVVEEEPAEEEPLELQEEPFFTEAEAFDEVSLDAGWETLDAQEEAPAEVAAALEPPAGAPEPSELQAPTAGEDLGVSQAPALDEQEVSRIVEKIATQVVERLAGTLLERIAWEVVPDLAESLIKDEIRRIKAGVQ